MCELCCSVFCLGLPHWIVFLIYFCDIFSQVENIDPLVHRAIAAASALPDLRGKINMHV
jgi:hypothetical protein